MNRNEFLKTIILSVVKDLQPVVNREEIHLSEFLSDDIKLSKTQVDKLFNPNKEITETEFESIRSKINLYIVERMNSFDLGMNILTNLRYTLEMDFIDFKIFEFIKKQGESDFNDIIASTAFTTKQVTESIKKLIDLKKIKYSTNLDTYFLIKEHDKD